MLVQRLYQRLKNVYHHFQAHFWRVFYGFPDKGLTIYGITGTNGKTTTCYVLAGILAAEHGAEHVGMLATVVFRVGDKETVNETKLTTLPSKLVYRYLRKMEHVGVTHVVVEMTSHALDQNRLAGIKLDGAIILNIAREHLDYHKTMHEYARAKLKIVKYIKPQSPLVVKGDDKRIKETINQLRITNYELRITEFTAAQAQAVQTPLEGEMNRENVLAASLLAQAVGISQRAVDKGIASVKQVPGRMEWVACPRPCPRHGETCPAEPWRSGVLIDYAVTPDALERLYKGIKVQTSGRVLALLGAAGLRDRGKRPAMAKAVAKYADILVFSREDPWTEPEEQIFSDLEQGLSRHCERSEAISNNNKIALSPPAPRDDKCRYYWKRIVDRKEAIQFLLEQARPGDIVVVTGKGAETGMGIGKKIIPWNDREVIEEILNNP